MSIVRKSMQQLSIKKDFVAENDLGFKNLVVSGCSFTYTSHQSGPPTTWPYYLRDLANISHVFSCAVPGAGNYFISQSTIWGLENKKLLPEQTLIVVMWSGNDREDEIFSYEAIDQFSNFTYQFTDKVCHGLTGSPTRDGDGNTNWFGYKDIHKFKTHESRAVENAIWIIGLKRYLDALNFRSVFVKFLDPIYPNRTQNFDIANFLPDPIKTTYNAVMDPVQDPYSFCLKRSLLGDDDLHPSPDGHLAWTREILLPYLNKKFQ